MYYYYSSSSDDYYDDDSDDGNNENFIYDNDGYVMVWVDGSCLGNGTPYARAGYGVFYNWNHNMNVSAPVKGRATNNAGEIQSATRAIWDCSQADIDCLRIMTDSKFVCRSVYEWMWRWERNGFCKTNGEPLANQRDFYELNKAMRRNSHMDIDFCYVPAHSGDQYNDEADSLARAGAEQYINYY